MTKIVRLTIHHIDVPGSAKLNTNLSLVLNALNRFPDLHAHFRGNSSSIWRKLKWEEYGSRISFSFSSLWKPPIHSNIKPDWQKGICLVSKTLSSKFDKIVDQECKQRQVKNTSYKASMVFFSRRVIFFST